MGVAAGDTVDDLFPGSGAVSFAIQSVLRDLQTPAAAKAAAASSTA